MSKKLVIIFLLVVAGVFFEAYSFQRSLNKEAVITPIPTISPTSKPSPTEIPIISTTPTPASNLSNIQLIKLDVPFIAQAPFGEWSDLRQQNACEEAAAIIAVYWAKGQNLSLQEAKNKILAISDWEQKNYGIYQDTSARDTVDRIFKEYLGYQKVKVVNNITTQNIIDELVKGNLVIVPANGQALKNKFFRFPGPLEHMLVIIGYDYRSKEFITNDPGTRHGKDYRYNQEVLFNAIRDYPTGYHRPIVGVQKTMIVVQK